ncbi:hypothetical protein H0H81_003816 [Sphagnurus paluster]|uniref:Uncharacterized protein n=1 Tax=Sphagnurus paluster TaxID=117069 RepID=A0A9P7KL58_9AGAR|nr:hypothetical protein H0H81_003816 [Sphagnurus paluster]
MGDPSVTPSTGLTDNTAFKTSEGTLYVSKPYRSKSSKKLRAMITFTPRKSHFDISNESSGTNEFRIRDNVLARCSGSGNKRCGAGLEHQPMRSIRDGPPEAMDQILLDWPRYPALIPNLCSGCGGDMDIQSVCHALSSYHVTSFTRYSKWPWVQSGFLTLHSLVSRIVNRRSVIIDTFQVMIMKMHSYMSVNGHLQRVSIQSEEILQELRQMTNSFGGWDQAMKDAAARRLALNVAAGLHSSSPSTSPSDTPSTPEAASGSTTSYTDAATAQALRQRLTSVTKATKGNIVVSDAPGTPTQDDPRKGTPFEPHPLVDHPEEQVAELARDYSDLKSELTSPGPTFVTWPDTISFSNFALYQIIPTLVYELEYPRTERYVHPM